MAEFAAFTIAFAAICNKIYKNGPDILHGIAMTVERFWAAIWPIISTTAIVLSFCVIVYKLGRYLYCLLENNQRHIADLENNIAEKQKTITTQDSEITRLEKQIFQYSSKSKRLEGRLARYHRLLIQQFRAKGVALSESKKQARNALASVLKDFGGDRARVNRDGLL